MKSVPSEAFDELRNALTAQGYGELSMSYEPWEWEEGNRLIYEETVRIKSKLEELLFARIRFVIQNGASPSDKLVEFTREDRRRPQPSCTAQPDPRTFGRLHLAV